MPTQTTDLFLLEDLEETRSKREPLVRARRACNSPKWCRAGENMAERLGHVDDGLNASHHNSWSRPSARRAAPCYSLESVCCSLYYR